MARKLASRGQWHQRAGAESTSLSSSLFDRVPPGRRPSRQFERGVRTQAHESAVANAEWHARDQRGPGDGNDPSVAVSALHPDGFGAVTLKDSDGFAVPGVNRQRDRRGRRPSPAPRDGSLGGASPIARWRHPGCARPRGARSRRSRIVRFRGGRAPAQLGWGVLRQPVRGEVMGTRSAAKVRFRRDGLARAGPDAGCSP
jgi:hypothetical protein